MISLLANQKKGEQAPSTRLEGDATGQLIASLIAQHLSDLLQMREDMEAKVVPLWRAPEAIRSTAEYEARFSVNRLDPKLRQAAEWKAAQALAYTASGVSPAAGGVKVTNRELQLARSAILTYVAVLDGSHSPLTLKEYAAAMVEQAKGGMK